MAETEKREGIIYPDMECYQMFYSYSVPDAELTFVRDTLTARKDFGGFITASEDVYKRQS